MLDDVKKRLRIKNEVYDGEIYDLIDSAKADLKLIGISESILREDLYIGFDAIIKNAIILYVKANFGLDNNDSSKYQDAYDKLKIRLSMSQYCTE